MNYQAIIQSQNGANGGWLDYVREPLNLKGTATAAEAVEKASILAGIARENYAGKAPAFRARIEAWGEDPLGIDGRTVRGD